MDAGSAAEVGPPHELLQRPDGLFSALVRGAGTAAEAGLRRAAEAAYATRHATVSGTPQAAVVSDALSAAMPA